MRYFLVILILFISGCSQDQWNEKLSTPEDRKIAQQTVETMRAGKIASLQPLMEQQLYTETKKISRTTLDALAEPGDLELVTVNSNSFTADGKTEITKGLNYQYGSGSKWFMFQVTLKETDKGPLVVGWHATPYNVKPTSAGSFDFKSKGIVHYFWIAAMIASIATIIFAIVAAIRSKGIKRRWLWILGCLFGLGNFSLNWTTGVWGIQPVYASLLGASFLKNSPFDAWVLSFSLPIVALVFLWKRSSLLSHSQAD